MALMIPSVLSNEVKSTAERRIFNWFSSAEGTGDWIVMHSLGIANHDRLIYGETDFFVLAPGYGLFALEAKGGRLKRKNGIWYFIDKYGNSGSKVRGPFDQARDGAYSIVRSIKERLNKEHHHLSNVLFGYGVMFPDIEYIAADLDEEQWQIFDLRDAKNVREYIHNLSCGYQKKWEEKYGAFKKSKLPSCDDVIYLSTILRGDFDYVESINVQLKNADEALISLTEEQYRCLDQLDDNPRSLIYGPAGTGKTLLAIQETKKSVARGDKAALFCFNSNLGDWLYSYFEKLPVTMRPSYVGTLHKFMMRTIRKSGSAIDFPRNEDHYDYFFQEVLPCEATLIAQNLEIKFDKIIIDEAQDLINKNCLLFMNACLQKGLLRGKWTMFGDLEMQAIYSHGKTADTLFEILETYSSFIRFKLTINCRNTKPICEEIQTITGFKPPDKKWGRIEGPPVNYITFSSNEEQKEKLEKLLIQLIESGIKQSSITILSSKKRENSVISLLNNINVADFSIPPSHHITYSTIQSFKGLENTIIILVDVDSYESESLMYVGMSRARSGMYIFQSESAADCYQKLLKGRIFNG